MWSSFRFALTDPREALQYFYLLKGLRGPHGEDLFSGCVSDLVMESREFEMLLGRVEDDGTRKPGCVDKFKDDTQDVVEFVAMKAEQKGLYEDAIRLYDLAKAGVACLWDCRCGVECASVAVECASVAVECASVDVECTLVFVGVECTLVLCWCGVYIGCVLVWSVQVLLWSVQVLVWSVHWFCVGVECTLVVCWCGVYIGCVLVWSVHWLCVGVECTDTL